MARHAKGPTAGDHLWRRRQRPAVFGGGTGPSRWLARVLGLGLLLGSPVVGRAASVELVFRDYLVYPDFVQSLQGGAALTLGRWDYHDAGGTWIDVPRVINGHLDGPGTAISGAFNGMQPDPHWKRIVVQGSFQSLELRGADDDGARRGRPGAWGSWLAVTGQDVPATLTDAQYLSYRITLNGGDVVTQIDLVIEPDLRDAHPRLLVDDLTDLRARCTGALSHACDVSSMFANSTHLTAALSGYDASQLARIAKVMAFEYLVRGTPQHAVRARAVLAQLASHDRQHWVDLRDQIQDLGLGWIGLSWMLALDWVVDSVDRQNPTELAELQTIAQGTVVFVDYLLEMYKHSDFNNHFHLGRSPVLLAGLALHDEGLVDADARRYLDQGFDLLFNHAHPGLNVVAGDMGGWHESLGYFDGEMGLPLMVDMDALRTATGVDFFQDSSFWRNLPFWYLSSTVNSDLSLIHWADQGKDRWSTALDGSASEGKGTRDYFTGLHKNLARLGYAEAELAQYLLDQRIGAYYDSGSYGESYYKVAHLNDVLWYTPGAPASGLPNAPASSHFANLGEVILRQGTDADDAMAMFACADFRGGHQQADNGHFSIWYRGYLAVDSGYYDGWGSAHHMNYARRSIAHNTLTVTMPGETFSGTGHNDGGQAFACNTDYYNSPARDPACDVCDMWLSTGSSPAYDWIDADLTASYDPAKVTTVTRSFVWLRPDLFIVHDQVESTHASYPKRFLLHGLGPFVASGSDHYVDQDSGRLFVRTLLPASAQTVQVGGAGHEWEVEGTNYTPSRGLAFSGTHRLEISPPTSAVRDTFVHVLQVADQGLSTMQASTLLTASGAHGVQVDNWLVWFGDPGPLNALSYQVDTGSATQVLVGSLAATTAYQVQSGSGAAFTATTDAHGVLFFADSVTGSHTVTVGGGTPADAGPGVDAAVTTDAATSADVSTPTDATTASDVATSVDGATTTDAATGADSSTAADASTGQDAAAGTDAGVAADASVVGDASSGADAVMPAQPDAGAPAVVGSGCDCAASPARQSSALLGVVLSAAVLWRRRRGPGRA
ncbi:MAG: heparinase II/III family protein [Pseudomonadota bacterium]